MCVSISFSTPIWSETYLTHIFDNPGRVNRDIFKEEGGTGTILKTPLYVTYAISHDTVLIQCAAAGKTQVCGSHAKTTMSADLLNECSLTASISGRPSVSNERAAGAHEAYFNDGCARVSTRLQRTARWWGHRAKNAKVTFSFVINLRSAHKIRSTSGLPRTRLGQEQAASDLSDKDGDGGEGGDDGGGGGDGGGVGNVTLMVKEPESGEGVLH